MSKHPDQRIFSIQEVYYNKEDEPIAYISDKKNPLANWEALDEIIGTLDFVKLALDKPVIDLDNFPNEWDKNKNIE
jgi:hypothetical protein